MKRRLVVSFASPTRLRSLGSLVELPKVPMAGLDANDLVKKNSNDAHWLGLRCKAYARTVEKAKAASAHSLMATHVGDFTGTEISP